MSWDSGEAQIYQSKAFKVNENLVYGNIKQQQMIVNIYSAVLEIREDLMQEESLTSLSSRGPTAPSSGWTSVATLLHIVVM